MSANRQYLEGLNFRQLRKVHNPKTKEDYVKLQAMAKEGPLFGKASLIFVDNLDMWFGTLPKPVVKWIYQAFHDATPDQQFDVHEGSVTLIADWVRGDPSAAAKLPTMTWEQASDAQAQWHEENFTVQKAEPYTTHDVMMSFPDGYSIVDISNKKDLEIEGKLMGHCVGGYWPHVRSGVCHIVSLRDPQDRPHVTMEIDSEGVGQCMGKQNKPPMDKYKPYLREFFVGNEWYEACIKNDIELTEQDWVKVFPKLNKLGIRCAVARWFYTPMDIIRTMSLGSIDTIHSYIAQRPDLPRDLFEYYTSTNRIPKIYSNPSLPEDLFESGFTDERPFYQAMAENRNAPSWVLDRIYAFCVSVNWYTNAVILHGNASMELIQAWLANPDTGNIPLARRRDLPDTVITELIRSKLLSVRSTLASNRSLPVKYLEILAKDKHRTVRNCVALNNSSPTALVETMLKDRALSVRKSAWMVVSPF